MSRAEGFTKAVTDCGLFDDEKFRALWRALNRDPGAMCQAHVLHEAVRLESWKHNRRVTVEEAAPIWLTPDLNVITSMIEVGLLDADGRLPEHAFNSWIGPARTNRESFRARGSKGGNKKAENHSASSARAEAGPASSPSLASNTPHNSTDEPRNTQVPMNDHEAYDLVVARLQASGALAPVGVMQHIVRDLVRGYGPDMVIASFDADTSSKTTDEKVRAAQRWLKRQAALEADRVERYQGDDCVVCHTAIEPGTLTGVVRVGHVVGEAHELCRKEVAA